MRSLVCLELLETSSTTSDHAFQNEKDHPQLSELQSLAPPTLPEDNTGGSCYDIGNILVLSKSIDELCSSIKMILPSITSNKQVVNVSKTYPDRAKPHQ